MVINNTALRSVQGRRLLLASGMIGPTLLVTAMLIEGATRPGYNAWIQAGSSLSLSQFGWTQIANFLISGSLIVCFALSIRKSLPAGVGSVWGPLLLTAVGVGLILAGIFATDPALGYPPGTPPGPAIHTSLHGALHWVLGGLVVFSCLPAACFVFAKRWFHDTQQMHWSLYSLISGSAMLVFFIGFIVATIHHGPAGLFERISLAFGMAWIALFAARLLRESVQSTTN